MNITNRTKTSSHCSAERNFKNVELHTELGDFWMKSAHPAILKGSSCHCFHRKISLYLKSLFKLVQLQLELALQAELFWSLALRINLLLLPALWGVYKEHSKKRWVKRFDSLKGWQVFSPRCQFWSHLSEETKHFFFSCVWREIIQLILNKYIVLRIQSHKIHEHFATFLNFYIEWESNFRVYLFPIF